MAFDIGWIVEFLYSGYGLFGLFLAAVIGNATILLPAPIDLIIIGVGVVAKDPFFVFIAATVASLGAAIGEMSAYILGLLGVKALEKMSEQNVKKILDLGEGLAKRGMLIIFLGAFTPFPFDLVGIAAGLIKYNPKKVFVAVFAGKWARYVILAYAGFFGASWIKVFFGV